MGNTILISQVGGLAHIQPKGYLGNSFASYRAAIEGAKWNGKVNTCGIDKLPTILKRLRESGFDVELTPELSASLQEHTAQLWLDLKGAQERAAKIDEELRGRGLYLFPFQRVGVQWLAIRHGALLADEMGLGKTIQAIAALPANASVIVIAPAVAKGVWRREMAKWRPHLKVTVLEGRGSFRWPEKGEVVVLNYDIMPEGHKLAPKVVKGKMKEVRVCDKLCPGCAPYLKGAPEGTVLIADEAHALKNTKAQRTVKFRALSEAVRAKGGRTWLLTATPLLNRPQELWSIYQAAGVAQEAFGSWKKFLEVFDGRPGAWGGFVWGTPQADAAERIARVCLRRKKKEVLAELPEKTYRRVTVDVDRKTLAACEKVVEKYGGVDKIVELIESEGLKFESMSAVRHALAVGKLPSVMAMVEDYEEQEEPVVVFSAHRALVETLAKRDGWAAIMGGISAEERTRIEERFQAGELKGVACTIAAGGVAITLTRATNAIFSDLEWTPALNAQAEDRIHRIGQDRGVVITVLQANHELDERITQLLTSKQELISATVDGLRHEAVVEPIEEDFSAMIKAAEEEVKLANLPKPETKKDKPRFRSPETPTEKWVAEALTILAANDPDRAARRNDVGFNAKDGHLGHDLARTLRERGGLTTAQYRLAAKLCKKYHRQVGQCPEEAA